MRTLEDKVAVITGAAGGIGRALAARLAAEGCSLALADHRMAPLEQAAAGLDSRRDVSLHAVDVSDRAAVEAFAEAVAARHGGADVLVNNAGVTVFGPFAEQTPEEVEWLLQVNLMGVLHGCRAFLPQLTSSGDAHIVNMSSLAGLVGIPMQSTYCASKFAVRGFSAGLRVELSDVGVGVTAVMPGAVRTRLLAAAPSRDLAMTARMSELMMSYALPPEKLAAAIVRSIRRDRGELVICAEARAMRALDRVAPWLVRWGLGAAWRRRSR